MLGGGIWWKTGGNNFSRRRNLGGVLRKGDLGDLFWEGDGERGFVLGRDFFLFQWFLLKVFMTFSTFKS